MNLDIGQIVAEKLAQMEANRTIEKKIEETLEKTILSAVTNALSDYKFEREIKEQISIGVSGIAGNCGLAAYNGFIAEKAAAIVRECYGADFADKVKNALDGLMVKKHENVKLSGIFSRYRSWVCEHTEEQEKYDRQYYTGSLDVEKGSFGGEFIICRFADHQIEKTFTRLSEDPEIEIKIYRLHSEKSKRISSLRFSGRDMNNTLRIGFLTDFEQFILNLYYNETPILLDVDDVDDSDSFDIDI